MDITMLTEQEAFTVSRKWSEINGRPSLVCHGVSLACVLQVKIFEELYPDATSIEDAGGWRNLLKRHGLDWRAKFWASRLLHSKQTHQHDVWAVYDINNRACIDMLNRSVDALSHVDVQTTGIVVDVQISKSVSRCADLVYWTAGYSASISSDIRRQVVRLKKELSKNRQTYTATFSAAGVETCVSDSLLSIVYEQIFDLVREIFVWKAMLDDARPNLVLLSTDAHRAPRIITQLAKSRSIVTVTLQHGLPVWSYGYLPIFADRVFVWGAASERWFRSRGVAKEKIVLSGDPRLGRVDLVKASEAPLLSRRLVWLPNPVGRDIVGMMAAIFFGLASDWRGEVVVKLHPSERDSEWYRSLVPFGLNGRVTFDLGKLDDGAIRFGDIVVVGNSTAGVDAVRLGGVIVNLRHRRLPNPVDYERFLVGIEHDIEDGPVRSIEEVMKISSMDFLKAREIFVKDHYDSVDGTAAHKVAALILQMVDDRSRSRLTGEPLRTLDYEDRK